MKAPDLHPQPKTGTVLKEQTLTMGLTLRPLGIGVGILLVVNGALVLFRNLSAPSSTVLLPTDFLAWMSLIGAGLPLFMGRGSVTPFRPGLPWTLPMGRARHALVRVGAGWIWLMVAVAVILLWYVGIPLLSGGGMRESRLYLLAPFTDPRSVEPGSLPTVLFTFPWWIWLVPFLATTTFYLWASALFLATPRPGRWIAGAVLGIFLSAVIADWINLMWLADAVEPVISGLIEGRYGIWTLMAGGAVPAQWVELPTGESMPMFVGMPTLGRWVVGSGLWIGTGLALLGLAALRHWDGRAGAGRVLSG